MMSDRTPVFRYDIHDKIIMASLFTYEIGLKWSMVQAIGCSIENIS